MTRRLEPISRRTPLYALHLELGGKMVPFAGYEMPVQYPAGILKEHLHTRAEGRACSMSRIWARPSSAGARSGRGAGALTPADVAGLKEGMQRYALLLNDAGTIKDDFMFARLMGEPALYLVVNAAHQGRRLRLYRREAERRGGARAAARSRAAGAAGPDGGRRCWSASAPGISDLTFMKVARADVARRARHHQPHRLYRRRRFRDFAATAKDAERVRPRCSGR